MAIKDSSKELVKAQAEQVKKVTDQITGPMKSFFPSLIAGLPGGAMLEKSVKALGITNKQEADENGKELQEQTTLLKSMVNALTGEQPLSAAEVEKANADERANRKQTTLLEQINGGISDMAKGFLASVKKTGGMGLGVIAGLIAAPVIVLVNFFKSLGAELKFLNNLTGGRLAKLFRPITRFFDAIGDIFGKAGSGKFLKGDTVKIFGKYSDDIARFVGNIKKVFKPIIDGVGKVANLAKGSTSLMAGFQPVVKFAATVGRTLGRIFLPITILMGVIDGVFGFIKGFKEDGLVGGIKEGVIGVVDGLVGGLLRMITGAFAWILDAIGLDKFAASLTLSVSTAIEGVYEIFRGVVDVILFPFKLVWEMIKGIFGGETDFGGLFAGLGTSVMGIFDGLLDVLLAPFNMIWGLIQDVFSFAGIELPDFDLIEFTKKLVNDTIEWFTTLFSDPIEALTQLWQTLVGDGGLVDLIFKPIDKAINWVMGIFGWSDDGEQISLTTIVKNAITSVFEWLANLFLDPVAALSTLWTTLLGGYDSLMGLLFSPIDKAINWIMGVFGWSDPDGEPFSLWGLIKETAKGIFDFFAGLFDIDIMGLIKSIPGAGKVLSWFGFGDEDPPLESPANQTTEEQIAAAKARINASMDGENVYKGLDKYGREEDKILIEKLVKERAAELNAAKDAFDAQQRENNQPTSSMIFQNNSSTNNVQQGGGRTQQIIPIEDFSTGGWNRYAF